MVPQIFALALVVAKNLPSICHWPALSFPVLEKLFASAGLTERFHRHCVSALHRLADSLQDNTACHYTLWSKHFRFHHIGSRLCFLLRSGARALRPKSIKGSAIIIAEFYVTVNIFNTVQIAISRICILIFCLTVHLDFHNTIELIIQSDLSSGYNQHCEIAQCYQ